MKNILSQTINDYSEVTYGNLILALLIITVVFTGVFLKVRNLKN